MAYITWTEYQTYSTTVTVETVFDKLERLTRKEVDIRTLDRIQYLDEITDAIKELMAEVIDLIYENRTQKDNGNLKSYSNGTESFSYGTLSESENYNYLNAQIDDMVPKYLPISLCSLVIDTYEEGIDGNI